MASLGPKTKNRAAADCLLRTRPPRAENECQVDAIDRAVATHVSAHVIAAPCAKDERKVNTIDDFIAVDVADAWFIDLTTVGNAILIDVRAHITQTRCRPLA